MLRRTSRCVYSDVSLAARVASSFEGDDVTTRGNRMRKFIKQGMKTNVFPVDSGIPFRDVRAINGLIENFNYTGFYDLTFLRNISDEVISSVKTPTDAIRFMSNLTRLGHTDSQLIVTCTTKLLELAREQHLSAHQASELISMFARQRLRIEDLVVALIAEFYPHMSVNEQARVVADGASLKIPLERLPDLPQVPQDVKACTDLIMAFVLNPELMQSESLVSSRFIPLLGYLNTRLSNRNILDSLDPAWRRKLLLTRAALKYAYPNIEAAVPRSSSSFLTYAAVSEPTDFRTATPFKKQVSDTLFELGIRHSSNANFGALDVDIEESGKKVIWNCDTHSRFFVGVDSKTRTPFYDLRDRVLHGMGYSLVQIPYWHWSRITNRKLRVDYCRMNRHLVLKEHRATNEQAYQGEYFFKKSVPKRSWSWHGQSTLPVRISI